MEPEVALVTAGVEYDVLGIGYHDISDADRADVTALHLRPDFKCRILQEFIRGFAPRPDTTFGNVKADVLERFVPGYRRTNFVDIIERSAWPEGRRDTVAPLSGSRPFARRSARQGRRVSGARRDGEARLGRPPAL